MGRKRGRVPDVLWTPFKDKSGTLSNTLLSLFPKQCNCKCKCKAKPNSKCLPCRVFSQQDQPMSYLVRPHDPIEYRRLMRFCFVVIPPNAPPLSPLVPFTRHWSQLQIVERAIQTCYTKETAPSNVLCQGYNKFKLNSAVVKVLTSSAWELALERVGDGIMLYLLMHTLIFMPIKCNAHQQVAGPPVSQLIAKFPVCTSSNDSRPSIHARHLRKRRRRSNGEILNSAEPASKVSFSAGQKNGSKTEEDIGTNCVEASTLIYEKCCLEQHVSVENSSANFKVISGAQLNEKLGVNSRKRFRLPSWQRRKRRKRLIQDSCTQEPPRQYMNDKEYLDKTCHQGSINNKGLVVPSLNKTIDNQDGGDHRSVQPIQLCPCCSVLQSLSRVSKDAEINMKFMFYNSKSSSSLFLGSHVLYSLKPGLAGANDLLQHILGLSSTVTKGLPESCFHEEGFCSNGSSCLYHSLLKLLEKFRTRVEKCKHVHILKKHCSSQALFEPFVDRDAGFATKDGMMDSSCKQDMTQTNCHKRTTKVSQHQFGFNRPYCLKDNVLSFVWAVCRSIVPPDLLGSPSFRRTLRRNISRFIRLRRFEKFSLRQCLHKLEVSKFPLLSNMEPSKCINVFAFASETSQISVQLPNSSNISHFALNQAILERWIFWLFSNIVVPLVQAKFYTTESEHGKQNVYYYLKKVWWKMSNRITASLKDQIYGCLNHSSVAKVLSKRSFGFSKVRLCPKENGARPIANLRKPSRFCIKSATSSTQFGQKKRRGKLDRKHVTFFKSVNTVLRDLHIIFKDLKVNEPERWGSAVFSYNDIHRKLCSFLRHLKQGQPTVPQVYIVVSDVQKAFDTVNQDKLLSILNEIPMADNYSLQKSCEVFCRKKSLRTSEILRLMLPGKKSGCTEVISPVCQKIHHTIIICQEQSGMVWSKKLKFVLREHLKNNVLKLGRCFFLQTVGIPQGSVLSTLLCTLYYGHMERNMIYPYLERSDHHMLNRERNGCSAPEATSDISLSSPKYTLLRFVDDFLFISTSKEQASSFFSRLQKGFCEYNCNMNQEKFGVNFYPGSTFKLDLNRQFKGKDGVSFMQWSGLLINSCSLEVQADYSRYHNDHLKSTLTVNWQHRPGRQLKTKLRAYMRPKCHSIFFDSSINSPATIRLNVYQAFVLCAMKFHCYVCELSYWCQISAGSCFSSIEGSFRYMYRMMNRRMYKVQCASNRLRALEITKREVIWLGLTAYIKVLSKKTSRHKELLRLLRAKEATLSSVGNSSILKYAVDDSHSSIMWKIKY